MTTSKRAIGVASVSRYRFVEHLATGGMADIYAAEVVGAAGTTRRVAIKRVLRDHVHDERVLEMFANEARLAMRLQHPNIVQTYDVLDARDELYITMELLEGMSLFELLRLLHGPEPALSMAQSTYIIDRVLAGLHYAHELTGPDGEPLGLVHRDVSPHNVFLTLDGNVKLLDFGVAKVTAQTESHTESGVVKGKVLYMAPEHCQGGPVDRRADIFSTGLLLYTLLTNKHPFKGRNPYDTMRAVIHDPPRPLREIRASIPEGLERVVLRALEKDPARRYPTARDMQAALGEQIRAGGLYTTDTELSRFVARQMPRLDRGLSSSAPLPPDLVVGEVPEVPTGRHPAANATLAETPHAVVQRVLGTTLLELRGRIDERFDPTALLPHIKGPLIVDSAAVEVITSFGIRGLLSLFERSSTSSVYHIRCSVPFVQQISMVRMLLGGGKILSFHLPYVDPVNGHSFTVLLEGRAAAHALSTRTPPPWTCPGFPDRDAKFDEHPSSYLSFSDVFCDAPPPPIRAVLETLSAEHRRREVEKGVDERGTHIWIRRPLQASFRWRNVLRGLEGAVHLDLEDMPSWTEDGLAALVDALVREAEAVDQLQVTHAPPQLLEALVDAGFGPRLTGSTCRVHATCRDCGTPRCVAIPMAHTPQIREGTTLEPRCPACRGELVSTEDLGPEPAPMPQPKAPVSKPTSEPPGLTWAFLVVAVVAFIVGSWWWIAEPY